MKKIKRIFALLLAAAMLFSFAACGENGAETPDEETTTDYVREIKTKVAVPDGAMSLSLAKLASDRSYAYEVKQYSDPQEIVTLLTNGGADIAALPADLAAKLYKDTNGGIKILAVNTLSFLYCIENGNSIKSFDDFKGKTIYAVGKGTIAEYIINSVLTAKGLVPGKDITIEYKADNSELAALATEGKVDFCILPEPFATDVLSKNQENRKIIDFNKSWNEENETKLTQSVIVARTEYINENPDIISEFMVFSEVSINYLSANLEKACNFLVEKGYFEATDIAYLALPACNTVFMEGEEMKTAVKAMYETLYAADPAAIGGAIPDDGIFYGV